jgi:biotin operon repressor
MTPVLREADCLEEERPRTPMMIERMEDVLEYLTAHSPCTVGEIAEAVGLNRAAVRVALVHLKEDGHKLEREDHNGIAPNVWYMRGPGKQPCPGCGHLMASDEPNYYCQRCRTRYILAEKPIWPWGG